MKKRIINKHDQFLVWVFTMNKGEVKHFDPMEITRGLTDYGPYTMNPISVFTKGKFVTHRDGREPLYSIPGTPPARFVDANSLRDFRIEAMEDGSEYHCILPRDTVARFWERRVIRLMPGTPLFTYGKPNNYLYVAKGSLRYGALDVEQDTFIKGDKSSSIFANEETILAGLFLNEPTI